MTVTLKISSPLRIFTNWQDMVKVEGSPPKECLHDLEAKFPDIRTLLYDKDGQYLPQVQLFVNGERVYADEWANPLKDGDEMFILLAIGGG